jgi:hypothetical protein
MPCLRADIAGPVKPVCVYPALAGRHSLFSGRHRCAPGFLCAVLDKDLWVSAHGEQRMTIFG